MDKYAPKDEIIQAEAFRWHDGLASSFPVRFKIDEDRDDGGFYQLWVEKMQIWSEILPGDFIVKEKDGAGFYLCPKADFVAKYEKSSNGT